MADKKISALTGATTPLAGTEVLPIVQSGATVKVAVSDLTAGRAISATQITLTAGNLIPANGYGVDFAATPSTGTSELFADYEEGTFTPTLGNVTLGTGGTVSGVYTKIGRTVNATMSFTLGTGGSVTGTIAVGLPFTSSTDLNTRHIGNGIITDSGTGYYGAVCRQVSTTAINVLSGITALLAESSASNPMVWAVNDNLSVTVQFYV